METDAASSNTSSDSHTGSFCQPSNLNYYTENSFYFASSCKLDNYLAKKIDSPPKKLEYSLNDHKNIVAKSVINNGNKKLPGNSVDTFSKKNNGDEFGFRKFQTEFFNNNNNNNNCGVSDKQEINIQLNAVNSFGGKPMSFSPDQVSEKCFIEKSRYISFINRYIQ